VRDQFPLYPEQASNFASHVDAVMLYITAVCFFFAPGITSTIVFSFRCHARKNPREIGAPIHGGAARLACAIEGGCVGIWERRYEEGGQLLVKTQELGQVSVPHVPAGVLKF
jgi:hypothetical protein